MKRWLKVLLLVNFEFQGTFSGGGGGVRGLLGEVRGLFTCGDLVSRPEEAKTCSSLAPMRI